MDFKALASVHAGIAPKARSFSGMCESEANTYFTITHRYDKGKECYVVTSGSLDQIASYISTLEQPCKVKTTYYYKDGTKREVWRTKPANADAEKKKE